MKSNIHRILMFAIASAVLCLPIFAQNKIIPVDKPKQSTQIPVDNKINSQPAAKFVLSPIETSVFQEINQARSNPQTFISVLEDYKKNLNGNLILLPSKKFLRTIEGNPVLDEAIGEMKQISNLGAFEISEKLSQAARIQLNDLLENPTLGHFGKNGSTLKNRLAQFVVMEGKSAENICYKNSVGRDVVTTFIIDDGVKSRMHRRNLFSPLFKKIGVACGIDKNNEPICVTVFAEKYKDIGVNTGLTEF